MSSKRAEWVTACVFLVFAGCGGADSPHPTSSEGAAQTSVEGTSAAPTVSQSEAAPAETPASPPKRMEIPTISLSAAPSTPATNATTNATADRASEHRRDLLAAMMPLQVMLGQWHGTTQKDVGDFKALDEPQWVWDFQSDRNQPAMVMSSEGSPYFREVRLTYLTETKTFQMTTTDPEGKTRHFEGGFSKPVEEFQGDDQKMHSSYKLSLTQTDADSPRDQWQVTFNQQNNNRYLVELSKKRGANFLRFDTIATQREGTSFAKSDASYGNRECIISGGLGTIQVSYQGKSYWVCCTGCKAAFEEDPASWIAEYQKKQAAKDL